MRISINEIAAACIKKGNKLLLPKIGVIYQEESRIVFTPFPTKKFVSIIDLIASEYKMGIDMAYKRYDYWRHAISMRDKQYNIIHVEKVIWIIFNQNNDYFYLPDSNSLISQ